jgi:hypothetical protein
VYFRIDAAHALLFALVLYRESLRVISRLQIHRVFRIVGTVD